MTFKNGQGEILDGKMESRVGADVQGMRQCGADGAPMTDNDHILMGMGGSQSIE